MPPVHPFETALAKAWPTPTWAEVTALIAVSGGADSVALLRAMKGLATEGKGRIVVAHFNHRLRGRESDDDQAFVETLCRQLGVRCEVGVADSGLADRCGGEGLEAVARQARYGFLEQTAATLGARYVATAHTADDQIETILHRILRGTGIGGLSGMARTRLLGHATLIRPLLTARRADAIAYLADLNQSYRTDSSNGDMRLTRNRIRRELLPLLAEQFNPRVDNALLRLGTLAGEAQAVIDRLVDELATQCVATTDADTLRIALAPLSGQPDYTVRELLIAAWHNQSWPMQSMGYAEWDALAAMAFAAVPAKKTFPGGVSAELGQDALTLRRT